MIPNFKNHRSPLKMKSGGKIETNTSYISTIKKNDNLARTEAQQNQIQRFNAQRRKDSQSSLYKDQTNTFQMQQSTQGSLKYLELPGKQAANRRPMTAVMKKVHSQPRLLSAVNRQSNDPFSTTQQLLLSVPSTSALSTTKSQFGVQKKTQANNSKQLNRPKAASLQRNSQRQEAFKSISEFPQGMNFNKDFENVSLFEQNLLFNNTSTSQAIVVNIQDLSTAQRAKLQLLARKSVHQFNIDKDGEETSQFLTLTPLQIRRIFDSRNEDLKLPFKDQQFEKFKEHCERFCVRRMINLQDMGLGLSFARILDDLMRYNLDVSHLVLSRNRLKDEGVKILAKHLVNNKSLIHLDLSQNEISHIGASHLFEALVSNQSIISLDLGSYGGQYRNRLGTKGIKYLSSILEMPNTMLSHIYLAGNYIRNSGMELLAQGLRNNDRVMDIDVTNNDIQGIVGAEALYQILTSEINKVYRLVVAKNSLGNQGIEKIAAALVHPRCYLSYLSLKQCGFDHVGANEIYQSVKPCFHLKTLILDKNKLNGPGSPFLQQMVWGNSSVTTLSMAQCNLKNEGAISIIEGIEKNFAIRTLNLSQNQIEDKAIILLAKKVSKIQLYIRHIDLSFNYITQKSGIPLMDALSRNESLQTISLNNNQLGDETAQELIQTLKKNRHLKKINLNLNCINLRFIEEINDYLLKNELLALERVMPDFQREIKSMANDKKDYDTTCKDLLNTCINKAATANRAKLKQAELEAFKESSHQQYQEQQNLGDQVHQKLKDLDQMREDLEYKQKSREKYTDLKERELKAFITNTIKDQKTVENDIEYYQNEIMQKRAQFDIKRAELVMELQETNRRLEVERRSHLTLEDALNSLKKLKRNEETNLKTESTVNNANEEEKVEKIERLKTMKTMKRSQSIISISGASGSLVRPKKKKGRVIKKKQIIKKQD